MKRINALTIAGTDPSGGAGIQAAKRRWLMSVKCWANLIKLRINN